MLQFNLEMKFWLVWFVTKLTGYDWLVVDEVQRTSARTPWQQRRRPWCPPRRDPSKPCRWTSAASQLHWQMLRKHQWLGCTCELQPRTSWESWRSWRTTFSSWSSQSQGTTTSGTASASWSSQLCPGTDARIQNHTIRICILNRLHSAHRAGSAHRMSRGHPWLLQWWISPLWYRKHSSGMFCFSWCL